MHFIGHLQKNKVKYILDKISLIHSVDTLELAIEINKQASRINKVQDILLEVNVSREETKFGIKSEFISEVIKNAVSLNNVNIRGFMTVAPFTENKETLRNIFSELRFMYDDINSQNILKAKMDKLSMGMTNDFEIAIEEGSNLVRIGNGIFGKRQ